MKDFRVRAVCLIAVLFATTSLVTAQTQWGTPAFGSYEGSPDVVDLGNLNVSMTVPIRHKVGRGIEFHYDLALNSSVWAPVQSGSSTAWAPVRNWGWSSVTNGQTGTIWFNMTMGYCAAGSYMRIYDFNYIDRNGTAHYFPGTIWDGPPSCGTVNGTISATATDGSGLQAYFAPGQSIANITLPNGTTFNAWPVGVTTNQGTLERDDNGNEITTSVDTSGDITYTDTLGQQGLTIYPMAATGNWQVQSYRWPDNSRGTFVYYANIPIATKFGCSGVAQYTSQTTWLVDHIVQADGSTYWFTYEPTPGVAGSFTGRIASITLPTGGQISYTYTGGTDGNSGINCSDGSPLGLTKTVTNNGVTSTWTYTRQQTATNQWQTTVKEPDSSQKVITFLTGTTDPAFYETSRLTYDTSANGAGLLQTVNTCYNASCSATAVTLPITQRDITVLAPSSAGKASGRTESYTTLGLPSQTIEYDFGKTSSGARGNPLRQTQIQYAPNLGAIYDHPSSVTVSDGSGNTLAQTSYGYDTRGNLTTLTRSVSSSASLTSTYKYYDTGLVYQATDINNAVTTYTYGDCGNSFLTQVVYPLGLKTSAQWDCTFGAQVSTTDPNSNSSTNVLDGLGRVQSSQDPSGATTTYTYTSPTGSTLAAVDASMSFNSGASVKEQLTTFNQMGQPVYVQQPEGPGSSSWDTTQTNYDVMARPYQSVMPCVASQGAGCTGSTTTTSFDGLSRSTKTTDGGGGYVSRQYSLNDVLEIVGPAPAGENLKQKQLEYDGIGRLISVCEITSALSGAGACGQANNASGYLTTYQYSVISGYPTTTVTQNVQGTTKQTRVYTYDLVGRLISEKNPETNNLAKTYTYDSSSSGCSGTYMGDLVKVQDAKGNVICYQYDALHRNTQISYPSGPDAGNTAPKTFVYDAASGSGTTLPNTAGRLAEAYTGTSASKITDEYFGYSVQGELTDTYESTPNSGGYNHLNAGYWENGAVKSLTGQNYTVDAMGRPNSVAGLVTSTTYSLSNYTNQMTYTSGDSDQYTMDPKTGRTNGYNFLVNCGSDSGQMTWNQNGSLNSLVINDALSQTADTQSCSYSHDDVKRIAGVNCTQGSTNIWNQQFSYDAFGNINKSVPTNGTGISFLASYTPPTNSQSTNWITSLPGGTPTYDNNGQITFDGAKYFNWDSEGKAVTVDGVTAVYDALGRMVENGSAGSWRQFVYTPLGSVGLIMNGQSMVNVFVPLPNGSQAVYNSSGLAYYRHKDHLGSSRLATTPKRTVYSSTSYAPFGETYNSTGTTDASFTGQDQDTSAGLYDFLFRRLNSTQGRWISPDPAGLAAVNPENPQSWNRYAYVLNNPMSLTDAGGLYCQWSDGSSDETGDPDTGTPGQCGDAGGEWMHDNPDAPHDYIPPNMDSPDAPALGGFPGLPNPAVGLSFTTIGRGPNSWDVAWNVFPAFGQGSFIIQHIAMTDAAGNPINDYWESWYVAPGANHTALMIDQFHGFSGLTIQGTAGFYPGMKLPDTFFAPNSSTAAGILPSTTVNPNLPGGPTVNRTWTIP